MRLIKFLRTRIFSVASVLAVIALLPAVGNTVSAAAVKVQLVKTGGGWQLLRGGKPYFIKGAGGSYSLAKLKAAGGNSDRTWGADGIQHQLHRAAQLGMTYTVGMWLAHPGNGFSYKNKAQVQAQYEQCKKFVLDYRHDPAVLAWGIGNEMENGYDHKVLWQAVEKIAGMCHRLDPNHPTMTVVAEIGGHKVQKINEYCPDIDIIGINSYGGGPSLYKRYLKAGGVKPYVLTEFGPPGVWEEGRDNLHLPPEMNSTQKALYYARTYRNSVLAAKGLCLGSYAFTWGWKVEATPTWFGLILPDGRRLGAVDQLEHVWTGHWPKHLCPEMKSLNLVGPDKVKRESEIRAHVDASEPSGGALSYHWVLRRDISNTPPNGGESRPMPRKYPHAIIGQHGGHVIVKMPDNGGYYRLFCYVYNHHNAAAVGNIPLMVTGPIHAMRIPRSHLPLVLLGNNAQGTPYIPTGWMGNYKNISYGSADFGPRGMHSCVKISYTAANGWGGIAWQSPANDWGKTDGGLNLTGASKLTFWAKGKAGGERITFGAGLIGSDQPFHDSVHVSKVVTLTSHWKKYAINLKGRNLERIITGFYWTGGANGSPFTFYIDKVRYVK